MDPLTGSGLNFANLSPAELAQRQAEMRQAERNQVNERVEGPTPGRVDQPRNIGNDVAAVPPTRPADLTQRSQFDLVNQQAAANQNEAATDIQVGDDQRDDFRPPESFLENRVQSEPSGFGIEPQRSVTDPLTAQEQGQTDSPATPDTPAERAQAAAEPRADEIRTPESNFQEFRTPENALDDRFQQPTTEAEIAGQASTALGLEPRQAADEPLASADQPLPARDDTPLTASAQDDATDVGTDPLASTSQPLTETDPADAANAQQTDAGDVAAVPSPAERAQQVRTLSETAAFLNPPTPEEQQQTQPALTQASTTPDNQLTPSDRAETRAAEPDSAADVAERRAEEGVSSNAPGVAGPIVPRGSTLSLVA